MNNEIEISQDFWVEKSFYEHVQDTALHRTTELDRNRVYDWATVLGEEFVDDIDVVDGLFASASLEHLVKNQHVPLIAIKRSSEYVIEYILK